MIRTPDQRVRVFVSSTLEELAAERAAVRRAIEGLRLSPVMFELGARAHPPTSLYRAYLDQSHVFLGIYGQRYGWVAPGMDVSGLEDEYRRAGDKPKLVYIKRSEDARDGRLSELLEQVRTADDVSYKSFADLAELERLVADDLAFLLGEAFMADPRSTASPRRAFALPAETSTFVGRSAELTELCDLIGSDHVRLVTVTGPGGIGKTRLAQRAAAHVAPSFDDGAVFVQLGSLRDVRLVPDAIAAAIGVTNDGSESSFDALRVDLADRSLLLVLDNFEHLLGATEVVDDLLRAAPRLKVLVTSREALRVRAEHEFPVPPLAPAEGVALFSERVSAVRHGFVSGGDVAHTIDEICRRLEGVPLAIELAAARARLLSPAALLERLDNRLDALAGGARDLPERQRTLRATLTWSYELLDEDERRVFESLGAFAGSFSLAAAEAVGAAVTSCDVLDVLVSLADKSLLSVETTAGEPRFHLLEMIGEFARERLAESGHADRVGERHASVYRALSAELGAGVRGGDQVRCLRLLVREGDNLRAAIEWFLHHRRLDELADVAWALWVPAWIGGRLDEARRVADRALAADGDLAARSRARLLAGAGWFDLWHGDRTHADLVLHEAREIGRSLGDDEVLALATLGLSLISDPTDGFEVAMQLAEECIDMSRRHGDEWGETLARTMLGVIHARHGRFAGNREVFESALSGAVALGDSHLAVIAEVAMGTYLLDRGEVEAAASLLASSVQRQQSTRLLYAMLFVLQGTAALARARGDETLAALLLGAASQRRHSIGVSGSGNQAGRTVLIDALRTTLTPDIFDETFEKGTALSYADALNAAARATAA